MSIENSCKDVMSGPNYSEQGVVRSVYIYLLENQLEIDMVLISFLIFQFMIADW